MSRPLSVWWDGKVAGTLRIDKHGDMAFQYEEEWLADSSQPPLSLSLPKRPEAFKRRECRPFFGGLLPEERQLEAVARKLGISKTNDFKLLEALGGDVAGALTLWPEGERPPTPDAAAQPTPLDDGRVLELLDALPKRPLLAGEEGLRLSLAGAQPKLPVVLVEDKIALPAPGQPTTYILKPAITDFLAITENEALMMQLAAALELSVAQVQVRNAGTKPYLLVKRYDRQFEATGEEVRRLHQEDFCQALGIPPEQKYQAENGPSFKNAFELLRRATTRPALEVLKLLDAAIFNVIIGNADAHGKNFSLLYQGAGVTLAPLYDLVCTVAYEDLSHRFAMKIAKSRTLDEIDSNAWSAFANDAGLTAPYVVRRVRALSDLMQNAVVEIAARLAETALNREALTKFASIVASRAARVAKTV